MHQIRRWLISLKPIRNFRSTSFTLRWHLQRGIVAIPKSANPQRIKENTGIFDFELTDEEMDRIRRLNTGTRYSVNPAGYMENPPYVKLMRLFV
ncbi:aldo/keto reductase [Paenibacillus sp. MMS20-IR301]|uniref:aldo/keto reductase n=1 Tax=Paenibacillus sp. MMS20-IR301 TaxID=2895946 RepID=UPI0028E43DF0|nr:aldo/keto reductase [Paenibacillus sp. MMS20-IR301]WNS40805.1 aldo/keto reductase [Paenibacillus sp. MMS20-IR301]